MPWIAPALRRGLPHAPRYWIGIPTVTANAPLTCEFAGLLQANSVLAEAFGASQRADGNAFAELLDVVRPDAYVQAAVSATIRADVLARGEWLAATKRDGYLLTQWGASQIGDSLLSTEFLASALSDIGAQAETLSNTPAVSTDAFLPLAVTASAISDALGIMELIASQNSDSQAPASFGTNFSGDANFLVELSKRLQNDAPPALEVLKSRAAHQRAPVEALIGLSRDVFLIIESLSSGVISVVGDADLAIEWLGPRQSEQSLQAEVTGSVFIDRSIQAEWLSRSLADALASTEFISLARIFADVRVIVEWAALMRADFSTWSESSELVSTDNSSAVEFVSTIVADIRAALDILARTKIDTLALSEIVAVAVAIADAIVRIESIGNIVVNNSAFSEIISAVLRDHSNVAIELLKQARIDSSAPIDTIVAAAVAVFGAILRIETIGNLIADRRAFSEILSAVASDRTTAIEMLQRTRIDAGLTTESLGQSIAIVDAILALESTGRIRSDVPATLEGIIAAHRADVVLLVEALLTARRDEGLKAEAISAFAASDTIAALEALGAIIANVPVVDDEIKAIVAHLVSDGSIPFDFGQLSAQKLLSIGRLLRSMNRRRILGPTRH